LATIWKCFRKNIASESVDLIYLDPPFNSRASYNVLFAEKSGEKSAAQIHAFEDTWQWNRDSQAAYEELVTRGPKRLADLMQPLLSFLGHNDMMAYLVMMAIRLVEMHRALKPTGSIYLHCDPTASHYLKLLMDATFGPRNFRTEIVWKRSSAHSDTKQGRKQHGRIHDVILFYTRSESQWTWNPLYTAYDPDYVEAFYRHVEPETGRRYTLGDLTGPGGATKGNPRYKVMGITRHWRFTKEKMEQMTREGRILQSSPGAVPRYKRYFDEMPGVPLQDVWTDIRPIGSQAQERLGYPTQKPEALLDRIVRTSSNEGDVVMDPFCGCGTAIAVAERLKRRWIGIDVTYLAINLVQRRLRDTFGSELSPYEILGAPKDFAGAQALAEIDKYQFEWWAVDLIGARPAHDRKKGADSGVDGYINFFDDMSGVARKIVAQVKGGYVSVKEVRDLKGVMEREKAAIGALVTLREPTRPMLTEAASAGFYMPERFGDKYPKLQILPIEGLLEGKTLLHPGSPVETFKKAGRQRKEGESPQSSMFTHR